MYSKERRLFAVAVAVAVGVNHNITGQLLETESEGHLKEIQFYTDAWCTRRGTPALLRKTLAPRKGFFIIAIWL